MESALSRTCTLQRQVVTGHKKIDEKGRQLERQKDTGTQDKTFGRQLSRMLFGLCFMGVQHPISTLRTLLVYGVHVRSRLQMHKSPNAQTHIPTRQRAGCDPLCSQRGRYVSGVFLCLHAATLNYLTSPDDLLINSLYVIQLYDVRTPLMFLAGMSCDGSELKWQLWSGQWPVATYLYAVPRTRTKRYSHRYG
jgi:hypothetical protein